MAKKNISNLIQIYYLWLQTIHKIALEIQEQE